MRHSRRSSAGASISRRWRPWLRDTELHLLHDLAPVSDRPSAVGDPVERFDNMLAVRLHEPRIGQSEVSEPLQFRSE